jgi:hypothetical protein
MAMGLGSDTASAVDAIKKTDFAVFLLLFYKG